MGNVVAMVSKRSVRLMKVDGEVLKLKGPVRVSDVVRDHPNHIVLDAETVKRLGARTRPLDDDQQLKEGKKRLYFLVEMPKLAPEPAPRRVRSGTQMGAKERLENLMLSKRSVSDLTFVKSPELVSGVGSSDRVKMRVPKARLAELVKSREDGAEVSEKIISMCMKREEEETVVAHGTKRGNLAPPRLGSIDDLTSSKPPRQKKAVRFQSLRDEEFV